MNDNKNILKYTFVIIRWYANLKIRIVITHLVLGSLGIALTLLKLDSWSPGAGFIPIIFIKGINKIKKGNCKKKIRFMHTKRFITFLKIWMQFFVGAIPRQPFFNSVNK